MKTTALQQKLENIPPLLAGEVTRAILSGTPYPRRLLAAALIRLREGDDPASGWHAAARRLRSVAPLAGAWIETSPSAAQARKANARSPPSRGRGSKPCAARWSAYQSVRCRSTDFGQVRCEPEQVPTALKPAFDLGFLIPY